MLVLVYRNSMKAVPEHNRAPKQHENRTRDTSQNTTNRTPNQRTLKKKRPQTEHRTSYKDNQSNYTRNE